MIIVKLFVKSSKKATLRWSEVSASLHGEKGTVHINKDIELLYFLL